MILYLISLFSLEDNGIASGVYERNKTMVLDFILLSGLYRKERTSNRSYIRGGGGVVSTRQK